MLAIIKLKTGKRIVYLFFVFLACGFIVDATSWYLYVNTNNAVGLIIFTTYALLEAIFFLLIVDECTKMTTMKLISNILISVAIIAWIINALVSYQNHPHATSNGLYIGGYEIVISFMAGFALLKLVEQRNSILPRYEFWFLSGIFFYCFCSFFYMILLETNISYRIWFINSTMNIITYVFYSIGLLQIRSHS
jgi:hypothetical protein